MTDLQEKAMRMALERLESHDYWMDEEAIQAIRQALAMERFSEVNQEIEEALKQPKREWVGITKEDKKEILEMTQPDERGYVIAITEAKLKEKNA